MLQRLRAVRLVDEELGNFLYVEPGEPMTEPSILADVERLIEERQPSLVFFVGDRGLLKLLPNFFLRSTVGEDSGSVADYMCIVACACEGGFRDEREEGSVGGVAAREAARR
jgi:hypothetical protein